MRGHVPLTLYSDRQVQVAENHEPPPHTRHGRRTSFTRVRPPPSLRRLLVVPTRGSNAAAFGRGISRLSLKGPAPWAGLTPCLSHLGVFPGPSCFSRQAETPSAPYEASHHNIITSMIRNSQSYYHSPFRHLQPTTPPGILLSLLTSRHSARGGVPE